MARQRSRPRRKTTPVARPPEPAGRSEWIWRVAVGLAAFVLFAITADDTPALGDSPETVAGVDAWGVLHAPGYPSYVLVAKLFTLLAPVGPMSLRVSLFSAVCGAVSVALAYVVARDLQAPRAAAVTGAATLATGTSFWFYAGYEKHNAFTGMLVAVVTTALVRWSRSGSRAAMVVAGVAGGLIAGALWHTAGVMAPAVLVAVLGSRYRRKTGDIALGAGLAVGVAAVCYGWLFWRAGSHPPVNWGRVDSMSRFSDLFFMDDFGFTGDKVEGGFARASGSGLPVVGKLWDYVRALAVETTAFTVALAALGAVVGWRDGDRRVRHGSQVVAALVLSNLVLVAFAIGIGDSFSALLIQGGFIASSVFGSGVLVALGLGWLATAIGERLPSTGPPRIGWAGVVAAAIGVLLVGIAVPPHLRQLERRSTDYARQYTDNILSSLPEDAVLLTWGAEREFPFLHAQVVEGARPDVDVFHVDGLVRQWQMDAVADRLDVTLPSWEGVDGVPAYTRLLVDDLLEDRPVFVEVAAARSLAETISYEPRGLVGEVLPAGESPSAVQPDVLEARIAEYDTDDVYDGRFRFNWPNTFVQQAYVQMHLDVAKAYVESGDLDGAKRHVDLALRIYPESPTARRVDTAIDQALAGG